MFEVIQVMDRKKVANAIHALLDKGVELLAKGDFEKGDFAHIKVMRTMSSNINASVMMIQQETAQQRNILIAERMKHLGYGIDEAKKIEG